MFVTFVRMYTYIFFYKKMSIYDMIIIHIDSMLLCSDDPPNDLHRLLLLRGHDRPPRRLVNHNGSCVCLTDKLSLFSIRCLYTSLQCQETCQQNHHSGNRNLCVPQ